MLTPDGGGGPSGGPNEQRLIKAAFEAEIDAIGKARTLVATTKDNLDIVVSALRRFAPQIAGDWESPDGQAAVSATMDLASAINDKTVALSTTAKALSGASGAVETAQNAWLASGSAPSQPSAPNVPPDAPDKDQMRAAATYRTQMTSYDGAVSAREAKMADIYNTYQTQLSAAGLKMAQANSIDQTYDSSGGGSGPGGGSTGPGGAGGAPSGGSALPSGGSSGTRVPESVKSTETVALSSSGVGSRAG